MVNVAVEKIAERGPAPIGWALARHQLAQLRGPALVPVRRPNQHIAKPEIPARGRGLIDENARIVAEVRGKRHGERHRRLFVVVALDVAHRDFLVFRERQFDDVDHRIKTNRKNVLVSAVYVEGVAGGWRARRLIIGVEEVPKLDDKRFARGGGICDEPRHGREVETLCYLEVEVCAGLGCPRAHSKVRITHNVGGA